MGSPSVGWQKPCWFYSHSSYQRLFQNTRTAAGQFMSMPGCSLTDPQKLHFAVLLKENSVAQAPSNSPFLSGSLFSHPVKGGQIAGPHIHYLNRGRISGWQGGRCGILQCQKSCSAVSRDYMNKLYILLTSCGFCCLMLFQN